MTYYILDMPSAASGEGPLHLDEDGIRKKAESGDWILKRVAPHSWTACTLFDPIQSGPDPERLIGYQHYSVGEGPPVIVVIQTDAPDHGIIDDETGKRIVKALGERWAHFNELESTNTQCWRTLHAVRTLVASMRRPVTVAEVNEYLLQWDSSYKVRNTQMNLAMLSVNDQSRGHHQRKRTPSFLRSDLGNIYDQLFKVISDTGRVAYETYDIPKHGIWQLVPDQKGRPERIVDGTSLDPADVLMTAVATKDDQQSPPITSAEDSREWVYANIHRRRGQQRFREQLITIYDGRCAMTGCRLTDVLEAAHIKPYRGDHTSRPDNGLLLRADIHTLFDLGRIWVDPETMTIHVADSLRESEYNELEGKALRIPSDATSRPRAEHLRDHAAHFKRLDPT